jgi:hypothetical protein
VRLQVDLGSTIRLGSIAITRPDVLAIATGETSVEDHAVTGPTRSAAEIVSVSADGRSWRRLARVAAPKVQEEIAGDGGEVRYVRITAGANASPRKPLVVGELSVRR